MYPSKRVFRRRCFLSGLNVFFCGCYDHVMCLERAFVFLNCGLSDQMNAAMRSATLFPRGTMSQRSLPDCLSDTAQLWCCVQQVFSASHGKILWYRAPGPVQWRCGPLTRYVVSLSWPVHVEFSSLCSWVEITHSHTILLFVCIYSDAY